MTTTIRALNARAVYAPMARRLQTSTGSVDRAPMVLLDLVTSSGATGRSYLFTVTPLALKAQVALLGEMASLIVGQPLVPFEIERLLNRRFTLLGQTGLVAMAIAGIDMAAWDARAIEAGLPLARLLGGEPRDRCLPTTVAAWGSRVRGSTRMRLPLKRPSCCAADSRP